MHIFGLLYDSFRLIWIQNRKRVEKYLEYDYSLSENIDFGGSTGIEVISNLLVDDGLKIRTYRDNLVW